MAREGLVDGSTLLREQSNVAENHGQPAGSHVDRQEHVCIVEPSGRIVRISFVANVSAELYLRKVGDTAGVHF